MPDQTSVLFVPVKNENETKTEAAEVFQALPSLPPALTEPTLEPKVEKLAKIEISLDEIDIPAKKLKAEPECFLDDWFSDVIFVKEEKTPSTDRAAIIRDEIIRYMTTDRVSGKTDPLAWWEVKQMLFPSLSCLTVRFLSTPATSVPGERVFSAAGYTVNKQRSSLYPENVDKLIFLNKNYKLSKSK